jgi:ATP-dependent protease ClpP protease subunit
MNDQLLSEALLPHRIIPILSDLNSALYEKVRDTLLLFNAQSKKGITLLVQCDGGPILYALWLVDLIDSLSCDVKCVVIEANSSACALLQACKQRSAYPHAWFQLHSIQPHEYAFGGLTGREYQTEYYMDRHYRDFKTSFLMNKERHLQLYLKRTGKSKKIIQQWLHRGNNSEYMISAREAMEMNIIDEILPPEFELY